MRWYFNEDNVGRYLILSSISTTVHQCKIFQVSYRSPNGLDYARHQIYLFSFDIIVFLIQINKIYKCLSTIRCDFLVISLRNFVIYLCASNKRYLFILFQTLNERECWLIEVRQKTGFRVFRVLALYEWLRGKNRSTSNELIYSSRAFELLLLNYSAKLHLSRNIVYL